MADTMTAPPTLAGETETTKVTKNFPARTSRLGVRETLPTPEPFEFRDAHDGEPPRLVGLAARTDTPYTVEDFASTFIETIERGAFKRTLADQPDVVLLVEHSGLPLARTSSRTLELRETDEGLEVRAELDPTDPDVAQLIPKLRRGDMSQMSIAFRVNRQTWGDDYTTRQIHEINLARGDVSVVTFPANPATAAVLRNAEGDTTPAEPTDTSPETETVDDEPPPPPANESNKNLADTEPNLDGYAEADISAIREQSELTAQLLDRLEVVANEIKDALAGKQTGE